MDVNPNLNQSIYGRELRDELGLVRNEIAQEAFKARDNSDLHHAICLQGQHTLNLLKAVTSLWTDSYVLLLRETKVEPTLAETEAAYSGNRHERLNRLRPINGVSRQQRHSQPVDMTERRLSEHPSASCRPWNVNHSVLW
jgi:hypothetical protein